MNHEREIGVDTGTPGLVSVIIPTFNRGYMLGHAIESVLGQTYGDVEVIIADDGSTDDTETVASGYGAKVRYFRQKNAGVSAARNLGLREARGEFIALLDSDDTFLPWKLEAQIALLRRHPSLGMVWTDMIATAESGETVSSAFLREMYSAHEQLRIEDLCSESYRLDSSWPGAPSVIAQRPYYIGDLFSPMILGNLVHTSTVLLRRERLRRVGGFDEQLRPAGEDYEFHLRTTFEGPVAFLDASSINYRVGAADQLTAPSLMAHIARNNLTTVLRWVDKGGGRITLPRRLVRRRLAESYRWVGITAMDGGRAIDATVNVWKSLLHQPLQPRLALLLGFSLLPGSLQRQVREIYHRVTARRRQARQRDRSRHDNLQPRTQEGA
ncbi:MAG: glycosyltransferase family 2 protein [Gemmatimonadaceae bacterium]